MDIFFTQTVHVRCPRQIAVNYYPQHSVFLYLFNGDALYGQKVEIRHYILPFCLVVMSMKFVLSGCRALWFISVQSIKLSRLFCNEAWRVFKSV